MKSMFDGAHPTCVYLDTYGAFFSSIAASPPWAYRGCHTHPLHGELPNAPYAEAWVVTGEDEDGEFIWVTATISILWPLRTITWQRQPSSSIPAPRSSLRGWRSKNLKRTPMELMYMAHVNFRPVDDGRLVYSAPSDAADVRVWDKHSVTHQAGAGLP